MEDKSQFDLNDAIRQWRQQLASSPAFRRENLTELEAHLRDSALALHSDHVTPAEAFFIAAHRLGSRGQLEREFGKANSRDVWMDRGMWMTLGMLFYGFLQSLLPGPLKVLIGLALAWGINEQVVAASYYMAWIGGPIVGIALAWWLCSRSKKLTLRLAQAGWRWRWLTGLALVAILVASHSVSEWLTNHFLMLLGHDVSHPRNIDEVFRAIGGLMVLYPVFWIALLPVLWGDAQRLRCLRPTVPMVTELESMPDAQRAFVHRLQSLNFSLEEVRLLIARRENQRPPVESDAPVRLAVLMDRVLWMAAGVTANIFLQYFVFRTSWVVVERIASVVHLAPINRYAFAVLCLLLSLGVSAAIATALWRLITRHRATTGRIASFCLNRPGWAALSVALLYPIFFCLFIPFLGIKWTSNHLSDHILWFNWHSVVIEMIIPVAALLWLIPGRMKATECTTPRSCP